MQPGNHVNLITIQTPFVTLITNQVIVITAVWGPYELRLWRHSQAKLFWPWQSGNDKPM